jgi:hypothetical protein
MAGPGISGPISAESADQPNPGRLRATQSR